MTDLDIAKTELYEEALTLCIVKDCHVLYQIKSHRISGLIDAIDALGAKLEGASMADRVAGKALALLCVYAKIREVHADVMSRKAFTVFKQYKIVCHWNELVENVLDQNKADICPFEKAAADINNPNAAFKKFKTLLNTIKACKDQK